MTEMDPFRSELHVYLIGLCWLAIAIPVRSQFPPHEPKLAWPAHQMSLYFAWCTTLPDTIHDVTVAKAARVDGPRHFEHTIHWLVYTPNLPTPSSRERKASSPGHGGNRMSNGRR